MGVAGFPVLLLAGAQGAGHAGVQQRLLCLHGQQTQRGQIDAVFGFLKPLEAGVGLAGVGAADVQDEMAAHGPGGGILVLRIQGNQQFQVAADRPGDIDHGIEPAQALPQQLRGREAGHAQKIRRVRFGLGGAEFRQSAACHSQQHRGIALLDALAQRRRRIAAQPDAGHDKPAQDVARTLAGAAVLQGEEGCQIAAGLAGAHGVGGAQMAQMVADRAVVVSGQNGLVAFGERRRRPAFLQHGSRVFDGLLRLLGGAHGVGDDGGEGVACLRPQHVLPPPGTHPSGADGAVSRGGQQGLRLLPGPAAALQKPHGPEFMLSALGHGDPSSRFF